MQKDRQYQYPVYVPYHRVPTGKAIDVKLLNGEIISCIVPARVQNGFKQLIQTDAGTACEVIFYHLWGSEIPFRKEIVECFESFPLKERTKELLSDAVENLFDPAKGFYNLAVMDLLDYGVLRAKETGWFSGKKAEEFKQRYIIATQQARIQLLDTLVEELLGALNATKQTKSFWQRIVSSFHRRNGEDSTADMEKKLRSIWQHVKHQEPIDDWDSMQQLDQLVFDAPIPQSLKAYYSKASILVKSITADLWVLRVIQEACKNSPEKMEELAKQWHLMREGDSGYFSNFWKSKDAVKSLREELEKLVYSSDIPEEAKVVFRLVVSGQMSEKGNNLTAEADPEKLQEIFEEAQKAVERATGLYSQAQQFAVYVGARAGTGTAIASLTGAAKTTSVLAWLGMGSVASGGLGMLGGLAVLTGGAALLGAAAVISIAGLMGPLGGDNLKHAAIGAGGGVAVGAGVAWGVWSIALAGSGYSGAAAITSTLAAFGGGSLAAGGMGMAGGIAVLTGGAAILALASGAGIKWILDKRNHSKVLGHMEGQVELLDRELQTLGLIGPSGS